MNLLERESQQERDIVLNMNEYCYVQDRTKGVIRVCVGPDKVTIGNTDQLVRFDENHKRFVPESGDRAKQLFATAPEGWYLELKNPAQKNEQPPAGTPTPVKADLLEVGKKINISGPAHIPLWPGQMVKIIRGHTLRSNQYLLLRVYDEGSANQHWKDVVIKAQTGKEKVGDNIQKSLATGSLIVLNGTDVSFFIPPTGIEVIPEIVNGKEKYVRDAETLERLEYCILLNESGEKRYVEGPDVVFPTPTETFKEKDGKRKFRAYELTENSGIYVKVIADYESYHVGEELFITGKEQQIYFPREEHAIIRYGKQDIHYAIAIPSGEGRYVLNRKTGAVSIARGPQMLLPDPRSEVVVRRILDTHECNLYYPGNREALTHNQSLLNETSGEEISSIFGSYSNTMYGGGRGYAAAPIAVAMAAEIEEDLLTETAEEHLGVRKFADQVQRKSKYTPPRTVTLHNKYEGPVTINIWTGYAVQVVSKSGKRKVIEGPQTYLLEYDESLEKISLSKGVPKRSQDLIETVYLRTKNNHVVDLIEAETKDMIPVRIKLSHKVNFEGDSSKWFEVENYVKLLCDHVRSRLRNTIKKHDIHSFNDEAIDIIRGTILDEEHQFFSENNMRIYEVEVLDVEVGNDSIKKMLVEAQLSIVQNTIRVKVGENEARTNSQLEEFQRQSLQEVGKTEEVRHTKNLDKINRQKTENMRIVEREITLELEKLKGSFESQKQMLENSRVILERQGNEQHQVVEFEKARQDVAMEQLRKETEAAVDRLKAIQPGFIEAVNNLAQSELLTKALPSMAPLAIVQQQSLVGAMAKLVEGTPLQSVMEKLAGTVKETQKAVDRK